ncbi:unnamed protein product [Heterobilharzia americana]|nr:unnamed protein product [Heterobilharzia americana]
MSPVNKREDRMNEKSTRMSSMPEDEEITTEQTTPEMKSASTLHAGIIAPIVVECIFAVVVVAFIMY